MRLPLFCLLWFALLGSVSSALAQGLSIGPAPGWVVRREATSASVTPFDGPVTYLLVDRQDSFVGPHPQSYFRMVGRINNPAGLDEMSQITADFDPTYERLVFHEVKITREEGAPRIALKPEIFELIRREKDSERQIFDGTLTASYLLHDLRVGDIVEYAYSVVGHNPLLGKKFSGRHELNWNVPVLEAQIRQIWPADVPVHWKVNRPDITIQQRVEGNTVIHQWTGRKLSPHLEEDLVPSWIDPMDTYAFSNWQDWDEVVRWALPLYEVNAASELALDKLIEQIRRRFQTPKSQVEEAIRFVQDDIRYVGIEMGAGSFVPRQPAEVLQKRFGDCKDKTLLLTRLIQKLGYEAFPILVKSEGGQNLEKYPASPLLFNHVITGVRDPAAKKDAVYWVDGTMQHQAVTLEARDYPNLYQGLPIVAGTKALIKQDPALTPVGRIEYSERYAVGDFSEPVVLTIKSRFLGWQAEKMRADLAAQGSAVLSDTFANYIKKIYPEAEIKQEPVFQDDRLINELTVEESYEIPDLWREGDNGVWRLDVSAGAYIGQYMAVPQKVKRLQPITLAHPLEIMHQQDIEIPADWSAKDDETEIENAGFRYHLAQSYQNGVLTFVHDWSSKADQVGLSDLAEYLRDVDSVKQELGRYVSYKPKPAPTVRERFTVAFPQILGLFILFLVAIGWQLQTDDWKEGTMIWPRRSLPFMMGMLILSSGAFALFWYADADRRLRHTGRSILPRAFKWLSLAIFAGVLTSRAIQVLIEPSSFQEAPWPMLAVIPMLHLLWAISMLRLLRRDFPELDLKTWPSLLFGPLYFQSHMQGMRVPSRTETRVDVVSEEPVLSLNELHPTEEGDEPRSEKGV